MYGNKPTRYIQTETCTNVTVFIKTYYDSGKFTLLPLSSRTTAFVYNLMISIRLNNDLVPLIFLSLFGFIQHCIDSYQHEPCIWFKSINDPVSVSQQRNFDQVYNKINLSLNENES